MDLRFRLEELKSRQLHIVGTTANPDEAFMAQVARNLTDAFDGFLLGHRVFICDRDKKFTRRFRETLKSFGVRTVPCTKPLVLLSHILIHDHLASPRPVAIAPVALDFRHPVLVPVSRSK